MVLLPLLAAACSGPRMQVSAPPIEIALESPGEPLVAGREARGKWTVTITNRAASPVTIECRVGLEVWNAAGGSRLFATHAPPEPGTVVPSEPYCSLEANSDRRFRALAPGKKWVVSAELAEPGKPTGKRWVSPSPGAYVVRAVYGYEPEQAREPCRGPGTLKCEGDPSAHADPSAPWNRAVAGPLFAAVRVRVLAGP